MKFTPSYNAQIPRAMRENLLWRAKVYERASVSPEFADSMRSACIDDPLFFINGFGYTYDPRCQPFSKLPFILYKYQEGAITDLVHAIGQHDLLVEKSRDMGASWLCLSAITWCWLYRQMLSFLLVSRVEEYVDKPGNPKALMWKMDFLLKNLPPWLMPRGYRESEHRQKLHIENPENGSVIDGESTNQNVARGDRRTAIMLDEFAAVENGESVLNATRDATNCRIFNSTPKGSSNAFADIRKTKIKKLRLHWSDHPVKNAGLYTTAEDGTLKVMDQDRYPAGYSPILDGKLRSTWYDNECTRVTRAQQIAQELDIDYLGSGHQFFMADKIQEAIRNYARDPMMVGDLEHDDKTAEPIRFREHNEGHLRLWFLLDRDGKPPLDHRYVISVDVSAGTGASNSVIVAWDTVTREKVLEFASPYVRPEALALQAVAIAKWLGNAIIIWESNGPGRQFGSRVLEAGYNRVYLRQREEAISKRVSDIPGWASTKDGKSVLLGNYREAIESGIAVNRSREALEETLEYVYLPDGSPGHSGSNDKSDPTGARANHGDRVMADALGWHMLSASSRLPVQEKPEIPVGCLAWRNKMREVEKVAAGTELESGW